mmetsp:Transcript_12204/g.27723  ORF Transcript_12204/g.27723 Transcript_12204/m.27723 type:complete len:207 (+) Transcript_12204:38-658(+)
MDVSHSCGSRVCLGGAQSPLHAARVVAYELLTTQSLQARMAAALVLSRAATQQEVEAVPCTLALRPLQRPMDWDASSLVTRDRVLAAAVLRDALASLEVAIPTCLADKALLSVALPVVPRVGAPTHEPEFPVLSRLVVEQRHEVPLLPPIAPQHLLAVDILSYANDVDFILLVYLPAPTDHVDERADAPAGRRHLCIEFVHVAVHV